jgi:hypothetical protein
MLARASVREREIPVRQAIAASRWRLVSQLLSESMLLALLGAGLGAGLAALLSHGPIGFLTTERNRMFVGLSIDWRVLGFTAGIAVLTCLLFGLVPALRATRVAPAAVIRTSGRSLAAGREKSSLRRLLVVAQVAIVPGTAGRSAAFVRSLQKSLATDPGFRPEGIVAVSVDYLVAQFPKERNLEIHRETLEKLRQRTGAMAAGEVDMTPVGGGGWDQNAWEPGFGGPKLDVLFNRTGPGYFRTMGIAFVAGREFDDHDTLNSPRVAIVNEQFERKVFQGKNPIGRTFRREEFGNRPDSQFLVVGLVRNTKYYELREDNQPIAYVPEGQNERPLGQGQTLYSARPRLWASSTTKRRQQSPTSIRASSISRC